MYLLNLILGMEKTPVFERDFNEVSLGIASGNGVGHP